MGLENRRMSLLPKKRDCKDEKGKLERAAVGLYDVGRKPLVFREVGSQGV